MKNKIVLGGIAAALLAVAACSTPTTSNSTTNTTTTTNSSTTTTNANRTTTNTSTSNTSNSNAGQSNSSTSQTGSEQSGKQDFTLHNATGAVIHRLYVSPHDQDQWGEDILGQDTLADGQSVHITFSPKTQAAMWDLRVEDSEGHSLEWENLNLLEISEVTLHYANGKGTADVR